MKPAASPDWPFGGLEPHAYSLVLIDPPWNYKPRKVSAAFIRKSPLGKYKTMSLAQIAALPVRALAARHCVLVCWATQAQLHHAIDIMRWSWGFKYVSAGAWGKRTKRGKWAIGTGFWLRSTAEFFILGTVGHPRLPAVRGERNLIEAVVREHSRKPDDMHEKLERMFPAGRRCELFARQSRPNWDTWGEERTKFDGGVMSVRARAGASKKGRSRVEAIQRPVSGRATRPAQSLRGRGPPGPAKNVRG